MRIENRRFNRYEARGRHHYRNEFAPSPAGSVRYRGRIKCRLAHGLGYSVIIPDQVYLSGPPLAWLQPLFFTPPTLAKLPDGSIRADIWIDVSMGQRLHVTFFARELVARLDDCSDLYDCEIHGPPRLATYATGCALDPNDPSLVLFHHTTRENERLIRSGGAYRQSSWNIAGTRRIANYGYAYFTALDRIRNDDDLVQIAMSAAGELAFLVDGGDANRTRDVLRLPVYRDRSSTRQATLEHVVPAKLLAPQHLYRHDPGGHEPVYFEVVNPFTYRIGLAPAATLPFEGDGKIAVPAGHKNPDHVVIGDATTLIGLAAPYDEDTTTQLLKLHGCGRPPARYSALLLGASRTQARNTATLICGCCTRLSSRVNLLRS